MKTVSFAMCMLVSFFVFSQSPSVTIYKGKVAKNNPDYEAGEGKMMFNYNDGEVEEPMVLVDLYLHKTNMDFTITDEKLVIFYDATDKTFALNQLFLNGKDLIIEGSALPPKTETFSDANVVLKWEIDGKPLVVILWKEYFQSSLDYKPKHKKKKK